MVMKTTSERKNMYDVINNMIMNKLQNGKMPWKQTWNDFGPARNYVSKKPYRGINALILNNTEFEYPALLLAREVDGELVYSGEVGTGFTNDLLKTLYSKIQPLEVDKCPLDTPVKKEKGFHWAKTKFTAQVQYVEITDDGHVRHPSFLGLRKDK